MTMRRLLGMAALAAAFLLPAAAARAAVETETAGPVTATLTWNGEPSSAMGATLTIARNGAVGFNRAIPKVVCDGCFISGAATDDIFVGDLDGDGENEALVSASTGGAECCVLLAVFDFQPALGTYRETDVNVGTVGFDVEDLNGDGVEEFVSLDGRFNALFTDHADQFPPPQVLHYLHQDGVPVWADVTDAFPALIRKNAAEAKKRFAHLHGADPNARGWLATYVADQFMLGHGSTGLREYDRQAKRGILGSAKSAKANRAKLLKLLHRYGYR